MWLDFDHSEIEVLYDQKKYAPNRDQVLHPYLATGDLFRGRPEPRNRIWSANTRFKPLAFLAPIPPVHRSKSSSMAVDFLLGGPRTIRFSARRLVRAEPISSRST